MPEWLSIAFWLPSLNALFGAGLGASFYILLQTQPYLSTRSFDPKYNAVYVGRFITGLVAGVILAMALGPTLKDMTGAANGSFSFAPGILAILGGYAAEAVQQILQRLVEVLLTAVKGDSSAQVRSATMAKVAEQNVKLQQLLVDLERAKDDGERKKLLDQIHNTLGANLST